MGVRSPASIADACREAVHAAVAPGGPGVALGVLLDGRTAAIEVGGLADIGNGLPVTPRTVFHIASLSKQLTAAALTLLEIEGRVDVEEPITRWLPETRRLVGVTVADLLHHQSGISDQWELAVLAGRRYPSDEVTSADVLGFVERLPGPTWPPGTRTEYANSNFTLLAQIVERESGERFAAFCERRLWRPLGMEHTWIRDVAGLSVPAMARGYDQRPGVAPTLDEPGFSVPGASGVLTTITDLLTWERSAVDPASPLAEMHRRLLIAGRLRDGRASRFARGLVHGSLLGHATVDHSGADGGFRSELVRIPDAGLTIVALANGSAVHPSRVVRDVVRSLLGEETGAGAEPLVAPVRVAEVGISRRPEDLVGTYVEPAHGVLLIVSQGDHGLRVEAWGGTMDLQPDAEGGYRSDSLDARIEFEGEGPVSDGLRIQWADGARTWRRFQPPPDPASVVQAVAGWYVSPVLQVVWQLRARGDELALSRPGGVDPRVVVADDGRLVSVDVGWIHLRRGSDGTIAGIGIDQGIEFRRWVDPMD